MNREDPGVGVGEGADQEAGAFDAGATEQTLHITQDVRVAPHELRAVAWLIDLLVVLAVVATIPQPFPLAVPLGVFVVYHAAFIWLTQRSVGKALFGLRVRRFTNKKPGLAWAIGRAGFGYCGVDMLGLGLLPALVDDRHRCLHDFVFGSEVVVEEGGKLEAKVLLTRLTSFAEQQKEAVEARKKTIVPLLALWAFLAGLGRILKRAVDALYRLAGRRGPAPGPSVTRALSTKVAATLTVVTSAVTAVVVTQVPVAGDVVEWLFQPRTWIGGSDVEVALPRQEPNPPDFPVDIPSTSVVVDGEPIDVRAFADQVVDARISPDVAEVRRDPEDALGPPDCSSPLSCDNEVDVSLGTATQKCQFFITLRFRDNVLVNGAGDDLRVVEIGALEPTDVFVLHEGQFVEVGQIQGGDKGLDLSPVIAEDAKVSDVMLCDAVDIDSSSSPGADIDAVAALNWAPR